MINGHVLNYFITASTFKIQFWKQLIQNRLVFGQDCDTHTQKCQHLWHRNLSAPSTGRISHNIDILHPLSFSFLLLSPVLSRAIRIVQTKQKKLFFLTFHLKWFYLYFQSNVSMTSYWIKICASTSYTSVEYNSFMLYHLSSHYCVWSVLPPTHSPPYSQLWI